LGKTVKKKQWGKDEIEEKEYFIVMTVVLERKKVDFNQANYSILKTSLHVTRGKPLNQKHEQIRNQSVWNAIFLFNSVKFIIVSKGFVLLHIIIIINVVMTATEFTQVTSRYEKSLALPKRKAAGVFYTDLSLAEKIIEELAIPSDAIALDPCCGTGSFNYALAKYGVRNIYGVDIDKDAIDLCMSNIPIGTFVRANSIEVDSHVLLSKLSLSDKVDYVIGNPPYAKWSPSKFVSPSFKQKSN